MRLVALGILIVIVLAVIALSAGWVAAPQTPTNTTKDDLRRIDDLLRNIRRAEEANSNFPVSLGTEVISYLDYEQAVTPKTNKQAIGRIRKLLDLLRRIHQSEEARRCMPVSLLTQLDQFLERIKRG